MLVLPLFAALAASSGWAAGIVLAQAPARRLGAFAFTRIQLIACSLIVCGLCSLMGYWQSVTWSAWPAFLVSSLFGIVLGNLAMIECLRRGGPRRTELLLSLKAPLVAGMAYVWFGETPSSLDALGAGVALFGVGLAIFHGGNAASESDEIRGSLMSILLLGVAATALQGFGFLVMKPAMLSGTEPLAVSAIRLTGAALVISLVALWPARAFKPQSRITPALLGRTILPGFIGYGISSSLLLYAFAHADAGIAAVLGALSPVLVLPILWLKEGQAPRPLALAGAVLAVAGAAVIVLF